MTIYVTYYITLFFTDIILLAVLWPGVHSAANRNEYQEYFLGVEAASV
jgi:hypothetical protein